MPKKTKTRAASGDGSIRQREDGLWEARVSLGFDPGTGKPVRKSIYRKTQKEVREAKTALLRALDTNNYREPQKITVGGWSQTWIDTYVSVNLKPLTLDSYNSILRRHILPGLGAMKVQELTPAHIQKFYAKMLKSGLSEKTVLNVAAVLRKLLSFAVKQGIIAVNPCLLTELPKSKKKEIHPLTNEEIPKFLEAIAGMQEENAFALCLFCGMREGEILGLSWDDVDLRTGKIYVKQQLIRRREKGGTYEIQDSPKNGRSRDIYLPNIAVEYLKREKRKQAENRLLAGELWYNPSNLVFTDSYGCNLKTVNFYKHFKKAAESIGRPELRPHDLRHTAATVSLESGVNIKDVQSLLGHATAAFTMQVYAHTTESAQRDTAQRVQAYYDDLLRHK